MTRLDAYLSDPLLHRLYSEIRKAGRLKSVSVDLTNVCNIRCTGCYFFEEGMDRTPSAGADIDGFIEREKARGTNFVTVVGGEPSLALDRLKKIYDTFWMNVATNGIRKIPMDGFEAMPIGVSVWADDRALRGGDWFETALRNYEDDPRAFWYYTVVPGRAHEIERVVDRCVANGNPVLFNFYSGAGRDFAAEQREIDRMIERHPDRILMTSAFSRVVSTGRLFDERWGYDVCTSITADHPVNAGRIANGNLFNPHFRAYNADFATTRRCCTGIDRDCGSCFDTWEHFSWVMLNFKKHLRSKQAFTEWLTTTYLFYMVNRIVDFDAGVALLPEIHRRVMRWNTRPTSISTARV